MLLRTQMRIFEQTQPSGAKSIEMHVSLTSKYGSQLLLATYTGYFFGLHRYLIKNQIIMIRY